METEQRKHTRFLVQENVIAALRNRSTRIGQVKDISLGGLSFEHIDEGDSNPNHPERSIFLLAEDVHVSKIPCRVVYDIPVSEPIESPPLITRFKTRRCGVQFVTLSEDQKAQLAFLLKTDTQ
jgi:hypothetical protein